MSIPNFITKKSTPKNITLGVVFILLVNMVIFPLFMTDKVHIGNILDLHFGFSSDEVLNVLSSMQKSGRKLYLLTTLLIDTPYALTYGFVYALIIAALLKRNLTKANQFLILPPFLISLFDLFENSGIVYFILNYPNINPSAAKLISLSNQLKWLFAGLTFILILYLLLRMWMVKSTAGKV